MNVNTAAGFSFTFYAEYYEKLNWEMRKYFKEVVCLFVFASQVSASSAQPITFTIDVKNKAQQIDNFAASGAWFSEGIGKYWAAPKKERLAELLFSKKFDTAGNPVGIGLSGFRFNVGGGTAEQGDSSGISNPVKRVESFLSPNGKYNWDKQQGYMWFVRQAAHYGVENLIAFSNTPPVQFTQNGLGFRTKKDFKTNLKEDKYNEYADFLATVLQHFDKEGIHFNYISPVNEPQWDWSNEFGKMNQEGSPWHNEDIYRITTELNKALQTKKLSTKILMPEAATLTALYEGRAHASRQIQSFFGNSSPLNVASLPQIAPVVAGHSYFTDLGDSEIVAVRARLRDSALKYKVEFWQSEYCMLGDGYKEGKRGRISAIDCALFLSKIIYNDLVVANASGWQYWNSWEPGSADRDTRYYLITLKGNGANTEGDFSVTKNLWALGHYSRFIRPGMYRIVTKRDDGLNDIQAAQNVMLSAFGDKQATVVVAVNYTNSPKEISLKLQAAGKAGTIKYYRTTANLDDNMKPYPLSSLDKVMLEPRSIATIVIGVKNSK